MFGVFAITQSALTSDGERYEDNPFVMSLEASNGSDFHSLYC